MKQKLHQAWHRARERFQQNPGVVGVGFGPKMAAGREVAREAIVVLVARKLPLNEVPENERIPATFEGFPTDVREPKLTIDGSREPGAPPTDPSEECLTDNEWIDWGKIHRMNLEQRRSRRGGAPGDEPAGEMGDAPTTEVVGDLFLIRDPDNELVVTVGGNLTIDYIAAYNLLRGTFGDDYDFVSFFVEPGGGIPNVGNASNFVFNDVTGIGWPAVDNRASWGSSRLLRHIHHTWFSLRTLMHEAAHQWLFFVDYRDTPGGATQDLLHQDWAGNADQRQFHWGRWPDNDNSSLDYDRADWTDNGDGTFNRTWHNENVANDVWYGFHSLDEHLMGLIPATDVAPVTVVQNPSPAVSNANPGPYTPSPGTVTVTIENVQHEEGVRTPDYLASQRVFHHAVVVITASTASPLPFAATCEVWRAAYRDRFRAATSGRLMVDTSLLRPNFAELYVKDNSADAGTGSSTGNFWLSPDLWVRNADDNDTTHQCPVRTQQNWVYVRVRNRGATPYQNVTVNVYLGNFATLTPGTEFIYPVDWNPAGLIGSATLPSVPAASGGTDGESIAHIAWPAALVPPAAGWHPCLLAEVIPMETSLPGLHHVWENPKLAQRNLTVIDPSEGCPPAADAGDVQAYTFLSEFTIGNALRVARTSELRVEVENPSDELALFIDPRGWMSGVEREADMVRLPVPLATGASAAESVRPVPPLADSAAAVVERGRRRRHPGPLGWLRALLEWLWAMLRRLLGHAPPPPLKERYRLAGLRPVVVEGKPLLQVTDPRNARLTLSLKQGERATLALVGLVGRNRGHGKAMCHVSEVVDGKVVGGVSVRVGY